MLVSRRNQFKLQGQLHGQMVSDGPNISKQNLLSYGQRFFLSAPTAEFPETAGF